jgi:predicted nucleic acid-binding protein
MAEARRVVLDTNTVLSALLFVNGRLVPLRAAWQSGELTPLLCAQTVEELLRVLAYPKFSSRRKNAKSCWRTTCHMEKSLLRGKANPKCPCAAMRRTRYSSTSRLSVRRIGW